MELPVLPGVGSWQTDRFFGFLPLSDHMALGGVTPLLYGGGLGHELVTDVVRLQFPGLTGEWDSYSVAYAVLLGAAETIGMPDTDLNVTITRGMQGDEAAIVLYDNVPGGTGSVAQLEEEQMLTDVLRQARQRVEGKCGCDSSCYGCLRSYRNQFAHTFLDRKQALQTLTDSSVG